MNSGSIFVSYGFAALAGICFVKGMAILSSGGRKHGKF
jgi:hypothetical protein